jgi:hypothetical protein
MRQVKFMLVLLTAILATSLPTYAADDSSSSSSSTSSSSSASTSTTSSSISFTSSDILGAGLSIINNLLNPPSRSTQIKADAEVLKAKIVADAEVTKERLRLEAVKTTDRVTPILNQWGVAKINCAPGLVFVNGITTDTVCVQPNASMTPGYYTYDSTKQQLIRNSGGVQSSVSVQTVQNVQTTSVSTPTARQNWNQGF